MLISNPLFLSPIGNLLENAYKYCNHQVFVLVKVVSENIIIHIEDDLNAQQEILRRGKRIDTQEEGHGLGLAISTDIIDAYQGEVNLEKSQLGGARFTVILPKQ